ncbi:MAG TPA: hypothetical protein VNJ54_10500 [Plantibacter sp.]|uniref:hypothetical protein n=1 Tax=unclassified Plantibacter TaxID=2624265 RepID=UPI002C892CDB|nr:hypothetical protein [Plantibacter sp.]
MTAPTQTRSAASGRRIAELAAELRGAGVPAGVTDQLAGVVRTAGLAAVIGLGPGMLSDEQAGAVVLAALRDADRRGATASDVADELHAVARLQTIVLDLLSGLRRQEGAS